MSKQTTAQSHNDRTPFSHPFLGAFTENPWNKLASNGLEQAQNVIDQVAKLEQVGHERAKAAFSDMHRLVIESLDYGHKLAAEWRTMALDGMRAMTSASKDAQA